MKRLLYFQLLILINSCASFSKQEENTFSEACKYYDLDSSRYIEMVKSLKSFEKPDKLIKKNKQSNHPILLYRALYIGHKGLICNLLKNNISPTPQEDTEGEIIDFVLNNDSYLIQSDVEILQILLTHGYKVNKGVLSKEIGLCFKKYNDPYGGIYNIPIVETLVDSGVDFDTKREANKIRNKINNSIVNQTLTECLATPQCFISLRLKEILAYKSKHSIIKN